MTKITLRPRSKITAKLLALTDAVVVDESLPTCAIRVQKGRVTLVVGKALYAARKHPEVVEQFLRHEAFHACMHHSERCNDRDPKLWNVVCDAAIHHSDLVDIDLIRRETGIQGVTFEQLGIPPVPPELAYDELDQEGPNGYPGGGKVDTYPGEQKAETSEGGGEAEDGDPIDSKPGGEKEEPASGDTKGALVTLGPGVGNHPSLPPGCGSGQPTQCDDSVATKGKTAVLTAQIKAEVERELAAAGKHSIFEDQSISHNPIAGSGGGSRERAWVVETVPAWVDQVLDRVLKERGGAERERNWQREHRYIDSGMLPGRGVAKAWQGVWAIDASGSINGQAISQMLSAVVMEPRLAESKVAVFDTKVIVPLLPVWDMVGIQAAIKSCGGGTRIRAASSALSDIGEGDTPKVWLTDASSSDGLPPQRDEEIWVLISSYRSHQITVVDYPR